MPMIYLDDERTGAVLAVLLDGESSSICRRKEATWAAATLASRLAVRSMEARVAYLRDLAETLSGEADSEKLPIPAKLEEHIVLVDLLRRLMSVLTDAKPPGLVAGEGMPIIRIIDLLPDADKAEFHARMDEASKELSNVIDQMSDLYDDANGGDTAVNPAIDAMMHDLVAPRLLVVKERLEEIGRRLREVQTHLRSDWQLARANLRNDGQC